MEHESDIVISGISGRLPECENVEEFWKALFDGVDLLTVDDRRYPPGFLGTAKRLGKVANADRFDANFFKFPPKLANLTDPRHRVLLETAYECVVDAGYNPQELRGTKTGVYVGINNYLEFEETKMLNTDGNYMRGTYLSMAANRISYSFDFRGPSYICNSACSSSIYALTQAFNDLRQGIIDYALVGGTHFCFSAFETSEFGSLTMVSKEGLSKSFSADRNGYVRSEGVVSIFLQKVKDCRRAYGSVIGAGTNCDGFKKEGISFPSYEVHLDLLKNVYSDFNINPDNVNYFEAHATGTPVGDRAECRAVSEFFCNTRKEPLFIGSVKSNMGHAEISSGFCSLLKSLAIFRTGSIPANMHCDRIDKTLPGIKDGKLKVVTKNLEFKNGLIGISSLGFGGANAHIVLKPQVAQSNSNLPLRENRLVLVSGRTPEAVDSFLEGVERNKHDEEFLALVDQVHKSNIEGHAYRGYIMLGKNPIRETNKINGLRPVWFIYSGMGCEWTTMGRELLKIEIFRKTFDRCAQALKPYDIDLYHIVTTEDATVFDDIVNTVSAISAIQISLTDVLFSMGIYPDRVVGHSLGEVGCAYADGSLTPEEAILLGFIRGYSCSQAKHNLKKGMMANVGLGTKEIASILPEDIYICYQDSSSRVTVAGPAESMRNFVQCLQSKGILVKLVKSSGFAFHSKYVEAAGQILLEFSKKVIQNPKPRSEKWISTSVPEEKWYEISAAFNSPEYHYSNFCNPVLFDQVFEHITENAIVVEVAPHGALQTVLKEELPLTVTNLTLSSRNSIDNEQHFLSAVGRFYVAGGQPQLRNLYPEVKFPVSDKTATISSLIKWDHSFSWLVPTCKMKESHGEFVIINLNDNEWSYLRGHEVDGRILMPAMSYLLIVWRVLAKLLFKSIDEVPVIMEKLSFHRATILTSDEEISLYVNILKISGNFEIFQRDALVVTGSIKQLESYESEVDGEEEDSASEMITGNDFYKFCRLRKLAYKDEFKIVTQYDLENRKGIINWRNKFDCFLDGMMQLNLMNYLNTNGVLVPSFIEKVVVDPRLFLKTFNIGEGNGNNKQANITVTHNNKLGVIKCPGIELCRPELTQVADRQIIQDGTLLESQIFIPYGDSNDILAFHTAIIVSLEIVLQNCKKSPRQLSICEIFKKSRGDFSAIVSEILAKKPFIVSTFVQLSVENVNKKYDIVLLEENVFNYVTISDFLCEDAFVIIKGSYPKDKEEDQLNIIFSRETENGRLTLLRKITQTSDNYDCIDIRADNFNWIKTLKHYINEKKSKNVCLIDYSGGINGPIGLANCLTKELHECKFVVITTDGEVFSIDNDIIKNQLKKNLSLNVLKSKEWGTYVYIPLEVTGRRDVIDASVDIKIVGNLSSLDWIQTQPACYDSYGHNEVVDVFYSALNFRDVLLAAGKMHYFTPDALPTDPITPLGMEFSGVSSGKRVMGICRFRGIALQRKMDEYLRWEVPHDWSLEDAATVPAVYGTVYYALIVCARMHPEESILIHSGAGATGMAAISVALSMNCEVFTTVSTDEKKDFLKKSFPQLKDENFGNSRNKSFARMVMKRTNGRGVDIILNSLSGDLFEVSMRCIAEKGQYLELGKAEYYKRTLIDSHMFLKGCSFHAIMFDKIYEGRIWIKQLIHKLISEGIKTGVVKPLPRTVFDETKVSEAFRLLGSGKHHGKVLIRIRKENCHILTSPPRTISATPRIFFNPLKSYIVTGGLGGVGLELADWMIRKGAKKLLLNSRSNVTNGYQKLCLTKWKQFAGIQVVVSTKDSSQINQARALIEEAQKLGPVGGIFNSAIILRDKLFINQNEEDFVEVFGPKFSSVKNLDTISRELHPSLDHFIVFSSISSAFGNVGQTNYAMANSTIERICERRKSEGLPALAVQFGSIAEVGIMEKWNQEAMFRHFSEPQVIPSCLDALENFMLQSQPVCLSMVIANKEKDSDSIQERSLAQSIAHVLGIKDISKVDPSLTMVQFGIDSIIKSEIKHTIYRNCDIDVSIEKIEKLTFEDLLKLKNDSVSH